MIYNLCYLAAPRSKTGNGRFEGVHDTEGEHDTSDISGRCTEGCNAVTDMAGIRLLRFPFLALTVLSLMPVYHFQCGR